MSVFIIAECGSNWYAGRPNWIWRLLAFFWRRPLWDYQCLGRAIQLVGAAATAGANAAKFQMFRADHLYPRGTPEWEQMKPLELPTEWLPILATAAQERGIEFMCSAFDEASVDAVDPFVKRHKVASLEITDLSLLRHIASKGKPVIMSKGCATPDQIEAAVSCMDLDCEITEMHCVTSYPCPPEEANVGLVMVKNARGSVSCGLSDHTLDPLVAPVMAVALGASVIEKHLTLDKRLLGPDHAYALEPQEFASMVKAIRLAETMLGDGVKRIMPSEKKWREFQHRDGGLRGTAL